MWVRTGDACPPNPGLLCSLYEGTKHTFATDAIRRGVPERQLQRFLGLASIQSTCRYARLADNALVEVLRMPARHSSTDDEPAENGTWRQASDKRAFGGGSLSGLDPTSDLLPQTDL
jgi:hypothetical protein